MRVYFENSTRKHCFSPGNLGHDLINFPSLQNVFLNMYTTMLNYMVFFAIAQWPKFTKVPIFIEPPYILNTSNNSDMCTIIWLMNVLHTFGFSKCWFGYCDSLLYAWKYMFEGCAYIQYHAKQQHLNSNKNSITYTTWAVLYAHS